MSQEEELHIHKVTDAVFAHAHVFAAMEVRKDDRLTGLDKIRRLITREAALRATGFPARPLKLPRTAGRGTQEMQTIAEEVFEKAVASAKAHLDD